jgi:hypothetical protein
MKINLRNLYYANSEVYEEAIEHKEKVLNFYYEQREMKENELEQEILLVDKKLQADISNTKVGYVYDGKNNN